MSRYFRDLHDRELLTLAEQILTEVSRRKLVEVVLRCESKHPEHMSGESERGTLAAVTREDGRIFLLLDSQLRTAQGEVMKAKAGSAGN